MNTDWTILCQPSGSPTLCTTPSGCANSLSGAMFNVIWGDRAPVAYEPFLKGRTWTGTGGAANDVSSTSTYLGQQVVKVPAFPGGVLAAVIRTQITQLYAIDSDYGTGTRTTWWVDGVGPVKVVFDHAGGQTDPYGQSAVSTVVLTSTNLVAGHPPPDANYFPLEQGAQTYEWTNKKHLPQPEIETIAVAPLAQNSTVYSDEAVATVKSVSGPMRAIGEYVFKLGLNGLTNLLGNSQASTLVKFPSLAHHRYFFTPLDLLTYGFNPILPAYGQSAAHWKSGNPSDFSVFGVTGTSVVIGVRPVRVPAGSFQALVVRSVLTQRGHPFGSGIRTAWFAPGRGLVKLVFAHRDGSTSVIELLKSRRSARGQALAGVVVLAVTLAGCGQQANPQRVALAAYLRHVQRTETQFQQPLSEVAKVGSTLGREQGSGSLLNSLAGASNEASLKQATRELERLRATVAAMPAPAVAAHLRNLLLALSDQQISLARELTTLALFLPRFSAILKQLAPASRYLQAALSVPAVTGTPAVVAAAYQFKAGALRHFAASAGSAAAALRAIHPPTVWRPAYVTQVASLTGMVNSATRLADALENGDTQHFASLMLAFDRAATLNQTIASQRAQIASIKAYDRAVENQSRIAAKIDAERQRLATILPQ